jgi:YHS domain-containing protein
MSDKYSWCQGPTCHKKNTQDRVRGVKGNKVLRTRKVRWYQSSYESKWNYFCSNHCLHEYIDTHLQSFIRIAPRPEPLETPCEVTTRKVQGTSYNWRTNESEPHIYTEKTIEVLDNRNE